MEESCSLNKKQLQFCLEYLKDFNGTQAAIRTGYSEKSAASIAAENLRKPQIKQEIERLSSSLFKAQGLSISRILAEVTLIGFCEKNGSNERLKALEILLKYKLAEAPQDRNLTDTATRILSALGRIQAK